MLAGQLTPLMHVPEGPASVKHTPTGAPLDAHCSTQAGRSSASIRSSREWQVGQGREEAAEPGPTAFTCPSVCCKAIVTYAEACQFGPESGLYPLLSRWVTLCKSLHLSEPI